MIDSAGHIRIDLTQRLNRGNPVQGSRMMPTEVSCRPGDWYLGHFLG